MFGNDYKKQCEELKLQLAQNAKMMEEAARHNDKLYIIKMVLDNPDQFMLDGEYAADDSVAVYGGRPVSFSEAVMFKAGKEAANRQFDIVSAHYDETIHNLEQENNSLSNQLKIEKEHNAEIQKDFRSSVEKHALEQESINRYHSKQLDELRGILESVGQSKRSLEQELEEVRAELDKWRNGEFIETPLPIITSVGEVVEDTI